MSISSCRETLPVVDNFGNNQYLLYTQDSVRVNFPGLVKGNITILGYIFTNCPDICPLTTNNMRMIQEAAKRENFDKIEFLSITFDPEVDRPGVLKRYVKLRNLDMANWHFLTGEKNVIETLIKDAGVIAVVGDSTIIETDVTYFYVHTDRISLMDGEGNIRKHYAGSRIDVKEIINDIRLLYD